MNTVVGLFDHNNAQRSIEVLEDYGVERSSISIVARNKDMDMIAARKGFDRFLCGFRAFTFTAPEIGPVIAAGTLASTLFTMLETKATSSLLAAMVNIGFSEMDAELYVEGVKRGDILVSVETVLPHEYPGNFTEHRAAEYETHGARAIDVKLDQTDTSVVYEGAMHDGMALEHI